MVGTRSFLRAFVVGVCVVVAALAVLYLTPSNHFIYLPDPAHPLDPIVHVPGESSAPDDGGIYFLEVTVRKASLLERLFPGIRSGSTLVSESQYNPEGLSFRQRRQLSLSQMSASQQIAITVALRSLGYRVAELGAQISAVTEGFPADGKLDPGDVIVGARGRSVASPDDLVRAMQGVRPGQSVELTIRRSGTERTVEVGTRAHPQDPQRAVMGISIQPKLRFPVNVRINAGDVGGPSAGLAFALDVVDELGEDLDRGRRIAVTGELALDGSVGPIGGVKQKTIGAREAGATLLIVPRANAPEARRYADGLRIVPVSNFSQTLSYLTTP